MTYPSCAYLECHVVMTLPLGPSVFGIAMGIVLVDDCAVDSNTLMPPGHGKNDIATFTLESPVIVVRSDEYMPSMEKSHCGSDYLASTEEPSDPCDRSVVYNTVLGTSQTWASQNSWTSWRRWFRRSLCRNGLGLDCVGFDSVNWLRWNCMDVWLVSLVGRSILG